MKSIAFLMFYIFKRCIMKKEIPLIIECYLPDLIEMLADYESEEDTDFDYDDYARIVVEKTKDWLKDMINEPNIIVEEDGDGYVFSGDYNYSLDNLVFSLKLDDNDNVEHAYHAVKRMLEEDGAYASFLEYIKHITTSRSGYIPRFGMEEVLRTPSLFIRFAIQFKFEHDYNIICEYILS